jgi:hypothetical protein
MDLEAIFGLESGSTMPAEAEAQPKAVAKEQGNEPQAPSNPAPVPAADDDAAFEAFICDAIARDQGLPPGSLQLWDPHHLPPGALGLWERNPGR